MIYLLISLTLFVLSFGKDYFIPSEESCNEISQCYNPISKQCDYFAPCPKINYCNKPPTPSCPAYPNAQCLFTGCGGCNTYFVDAFNQIIEDCDTHICSLAPETGNCKGYFPRYYFNDETQQCEGFIYGGCGGNANNFKTLAKCEEACNINICSLPADTGPCDALFKRYFYNDITRTCEKFTYGGCKGNDNNFKTLADCQQTCDKKPNCVPKGGSFMGRPKDCYLMDLVCDTDEQHWFDEKCGCGCKPKKTDCTLPNKWTLIGTPKECMVIKYLCGANEEYWGNPECGCGCKPKESMICAKDIKKCPNDGSVNRDPYNNCKFPPCPKCNEVQCLIEPCEFSLCDNYPSAICENDYCNGCNAIWTDTNGNDVTKLCKKTTTTTKKPDCVPQGWGFSGPTEFCRVAFIVCGDGFEFWSNNGCGCGCKPKEIIKPIIIDQGNKCETGGCSGQICAENANGIITTCEMRCEYGCIKRYKQCGKGISGNDECGWYLSNKQNEEGYNQCVQNCINDEQVM